MKNKQELSWANISIWLVAISIFVTGSLVVFQTLHFPLVTHFLRSGTTDYHLANKSIALGLGFSLVYLSFELLQRKNVTWWITTVVLGLVVLDHIIYQNGVLLGVVAFLNFILLLVFRHHYKVRSETRSFYRGLLLLLGSLILALVYGTFGFWLLDKHAFGRDFSILESFIDATRQFLLIGNSDLVAHNLRTRLFLDSLQTLGFVSLGYAFFSISRPLYYWYRTEAHEIIDAEMILTKYGNDADDYFKLWPKDKSYFFSDKRQAFIAYKVVNGIAFCLGNPIGEQKQIDQLMSQFLEYCYLNDWQVSFINLPENRLDDFKKAGLRCFKIGESAVVNTANFALTTSVNKHWRHLNNKFTKLGFSVEVHEAGVNNQILRQLKSISDKWLSKAGRQERGFALGYFSPAYIRQSKIFILKNELGKPIAFANSVPTFSKKVSTIDLMRHVPSAPTGSMEYLLRAVILNSYEEEYENFDLGLVPMIGIKDQEDLSAGEKVITAIYNLLPDSLSYQGLKQFKNKFEPTWMARFIAYESKPLALTNLARSLPKALSIKHTPRVL